MQVPLDLDLAGADIVAAMRETEGLTLVVPESEARRLGLEPLFLGEWITLEAVTALDAVGLTALFAAALAKAGISCNVIAGALHDHLFVDVGLGERAVSLLEGLKWPPAAGDAGEGRWGTEHWSLVIPPGWSAEHSKECLTATPPRGNAALQISAALGHSVVSDEDVQEVAMDGVAAGLPSVPCAPGEFVGQAYALERDGEAWSLWYLRHGHLLLFVTFTRDGELGSKFDAEVARALDSLQAGSA